MATNSILKTLRIKDKRTAQKFVKALELSREKKAKNVPIPYKVETLDRDQIRAIFGDK